MFRFLMVIAMAREFTHIMPLRDKDAKPRKLCPPPSPRPAGRPKIFSSGLRSSVTIEKEHMRYLRRIGNGNISLGIRLLVTQALSNTVKPKSEL